MDVDPGNGDEMRCQKSGLGTTEISDLGCYGLPVLLSTGLAIGLANLGLGLAATCRSGHSY